MLDMVEDLEYLERSCTISVECVLLLAVDDANRPSSPSALFMLNILREETSLCFSMVLLMRNEEDPVPAAPTLPAALVLAITRRCGEAGLRGRPRSSSEASGRLRRLRKTSASSA